MAANGVTGRMAGLRPWSWIKIALLILVAILALGVLAQLQSR